jgi:tetratricopeptide (TPR) repeat protein
MRWRLAAALLVVWPLAAQNRFEQFERDLKRAGSELRISDLRVEISESGRPVWKSGAVHAPVRTIPAGDQEVAGEIVKWWFQPTSLRIEIPAKHLGLSVSVNSKSLTEAARLTEDGNILRSSIALAFFRDIATLGDFDHDEPIDHALVALYFGQKDASAALVHQALDKFPELESTPDVTLLYLFAQLGLPETEASATAVIKAHPSLPTAWFYYGQYLENNKRYREAAACFEQITMHQPPWHNWTVAAAKKELTYLKTY